ncbi:hypothetical protein HZC34_00370 [Candidatus Saganbacteria bacterium]|nr:hypothetical protein [Candidatus Saganbacteria bacterium]
MEGCKFVGHNAAQLKAVLDNPSKAGDALTYVSLLDSRKFAERLSAQTGRTFMVQTEDEWLKAKNKLSGNNWTWTESKYFDDTYVLRHLFNYNRNNRNPEDRYDNDAVRLVEDR